MLRVSVFFVPNEFSRAAGRDRGQKRCRIDVRGRTFAGEGGWAGARWREGAQGGRGRGRGRVGGLGEVANPEGGCVPETLPGSCEMDEKNEDYYITFTGRVSLE